MHVADPLRPCVTGISSNRLGVAFLVDNQTHVGEPPSSALQRHAWRAGRLGTVMRKRNSKDQKDRNTLIAFFVSNCIFTEEISRRTKLHNCETMSMYIVLDVDKKTTWTDVRKNACQKSTLADLHETIHGTACGMYAMCLKQLSSYGCPSWEASLETLAKQKASEPDGVTVSTTGVFVPDSGGDEDKMRPHIAGDASTPNLVLFCFLRRVHCTSRS